MIPTGRQVSLQHGDYSATVTELGASLRELTWSGRPLVAGFGQDDLPRPSQEERHTDALLEHLDLVAHRRLRHSEFFGSLGEAGMARGGFERTDGRQRG